MDIVIEGLSKMYGPQKAVDNLSFEVKTGEILGFLGPNGAGKSTTMKMITGYLDIQEGDILLGGKSVKDDRFQTKKHIGYLPEHNPLYLDMPVIDYLEFSAALQGVERSTVSKRVREMVGLTGLNREKHKKIGELSKGYRQRVGLAQAMIHDPDILVLDEPTTGLDPNQIVEIRKLIRDLGQQKTVILSTHILPEVEATCDRILIINRGKIVANGTADSLRSQAQGQEVYRLKVESANQATLKESLSQIQSIEKVVEAGREDGLFMVHSKTNLSSRREVFQLCVEKGWVITELSPMETKLEDIFRNLTMN